MNNNEPPIIHKYGYQVFFVFFFTVTVSLGLVLKEGKKLGGVIKDHKSGQNSGETAVLLFRHLEIFWD